jgi:hypothetical protein
LPGGRHTFRDIVTNELNGTVGTPPSAPPACTPAAVKQTVGARSHYVDLGAQVTGTAPASDGVNGDHAWGVTFRALRPEGLGILLDYGGESFKLTSVGQASLRHAFFGGLAVSHHVTSWEATVGLSAGYGFGHVDAAGDLSNAWILRPSVTLWKNVSEHVAATLGATYVYARPTVTFASGGAQHITTAAVRLNAGLAYKIF